MSIRQDKFVVGDKVTWAPGYKDGATYLEPPLGDGPFTIQKVITYEGNHIQHVSIAEDLREDQSWSDAWFVKVTP